MQNSSLRQKPDNVIYLVPPDLARNVRALKALPGLRDGPSPMFARICLRIAAAAINAAYWALLTAARLNHWRRGL